MRETKLSGKHLKAFTVKWRTIVCSYYWQRYRQGEESPPLLMLTSRFQLLDTD